MPEHFTPPCDPLPATESGKTLVVVGEDNCLKQLIAHESIAGNPAIPIQLTDGKVELRDGSAEFPIELPNIKTQTGGSVSKILYRDASGAIVNWVPETGSCLDHKLIFRDGSLTFVPDCLPPILCADICAVTSCSEFDYLLGLREAEINCGDETIPVLVLVKVPRNLAPSCGEEEDIPDV